MPTIHTSGDAHSTPSALGDGTRWDPYPAKGANRKRLDDALFILRTQIRGMKSCNDCFRGLPGGRTFDDIFNDASIFLSLDPSGPNSGVTVGSDITISMVQNSNTWQVVATIVHEFAHINGVPGGGHGVAEGMLRCCGLAGHVRSGTDFTWGDEEVYEE